MKYIEKILYNIINLITAYIGANFIVFASSQLFGSIYIEFLLIGVFLLFLTALGIAGNWNCSLKHKSLLINCFVPLFYIIVFIYWVNGGNAGNDAVAMMVIFLFPLIILSTLISVSLLIYQKVKKSIS